MARKLKHSKIKNTSILFELLTRQITADVLAGKSTKSVKIVKKYFNEDTELGKELQLYRLLSEKHYESESRANDLINIVLKSRQKISNSKLRNEKYNLIKEINFLGKVPHNQKLIKYLSEAEIFILPSVISQTGDRDMQPNVVKEAMSMELLTIASRLGGINEVISNKKNGFLLENTSPEYIANKIKKVWLLSSKEKINIGTKARKTIINKFESQKINQQLISLFSKYEK